MSLMRSLEVGKRGLAVQQAAINTAGHNIANLSTPGYARQKAVITSVAAVEQSAGVDLTYIEQIRDQLIDARLHTENQTLARWESKGQWMRQIESLFAMDGEIPVNTALGRFWDSWQDLANDPASSAAREAVHQRAETLATEITDLRDQLTTVNHQINQQVRDEVEMINTELEGLADLNRSITVAEASGQVASDLRDERYRIITGLSEKINVQGIESRDNEFILNLNGIELVHGDRVSPLSLQEQVQDGRPQVTLRRGSHDLSISGGGIAGLMEVRDDVLPDLFDQLDALAGSLIEQVNEKHSIGYNPQHQTGLDFFGGSDSSNITVAVAAEQIATSSSATSSSDNSVALSIAQLRLEGQVGEDGRTIEAFFTDTVVQVALVTQESERFEANQTRIVNSLEAQQQSTSGVSLDEEMTSLIQFQNAYEATARYLNTVDEMLQSVIGMI